MIRNKPYAASYRKGRHNHVIIKNLNRKIKKNNKIIAERNADIERMKQIFNLSDADIEAFEKDAQAIKSDWKTVIPE